MPHRDPTLAARARCEQLRTRLAEVDRRSASQRPMPSSLDDLLAENRRLEQVLARGAEAAARQDSEPELDGVVHDADANSAAGPVPIDAGLATRETRRNGVIAFGIALSIVTVVMGAELATKPRPASAPPRHETTVRLAGVVVSHNGEIDTQDGERCALTIVDSGDREAGRSCHIEVTCPRTRQGFLASSCPIGEPAGPVRMRMTGLEIDAAEGTATFVKFDHFAEHAMGGATLRLDRK